MNERACQSTDILIRLTRGTTTHSLRLQIDLRPPFIHPPHLQLWSFALAGFHAHPLLTCRFPTPSASPSSQIFDTLCVQDLRVGEPWSSQLALLLARYPLPCLQLLNKEF